MLKNSEKFSAKILTPLKFKRNLLSLKCFLESVLSQCEMNGIFLSAHINNKRLLTSVALLLRLSKRGTMPNTITELPLFFNGVVKGCVRYIFASLFCKSKGEHLWNKEKCFSFHFKSSFRSWDNQIFTFHLFKCCAAIKCPNMKHQRHFTE